MAMIEGSKEHDAFLEEWRARQFVERHKAKVARTENPPAPVAMNSDEWRSMTITVPALTAERWAALNGEAPLDPDEAKKNDAFFADFAKGCQDLLLRLEKHNCPVQSLTFDAPIIDDKRYKSLATSGKLVFVGIKKPLEIHCETREICSEKPCFSVYSEKEISRIIVNGKTHQLHMSGQRRHAFPIREAHAPQTWKCESCDALTFLRALHEQCLLRNAKQLTSFEGFTITRKETTGATAALPLTAPTA